MKPLILTSFGRAIPALDSFASRGDVEIKRVSQLPLPASLDAERATVLLLDQALVKSAGDDQSVFAQLAEQAALVGVGEAGELEPPAIFPTDLLSGYFSADTPAAAARITL